MRNFLTLLLLFIFACSSYSQSVFKLKTGEEVIGVEVNRTQDNVEVESAYGKLEIPFDIIKSVKDITPERSASVQVALHDVPISQTFANISGETTGMVMVDLNEDSDAVVKSKREEFFDGMHEWTGDYRSFVESYLPEDFYMTLRIGYSAITTNTQKDILDLAFTLDKSWDDYHFVHFYGFYNYSKETKNTTPTWTNVSIDKYGLGGNYKYNFTGKDSDWFLIYSWDYKTDNIKNINLQIDQMVGLGFNINYFKDEGVDINMSIGPGPRYYEYAYTYAGNPYVWRNWQFMMYARQELTWNIHQTLKFEQTFNIGYDMEGLLGNVTDFASQYYSVYFSAGLVYSPTDVFSLAIRYIYNYDTASASDISTEERFILGIEIPIGWKK